MDKFHVALGHFWHIDYVGHQSENCDVFCKKPIIIKLLRLSGRVQLEFIVASLVESNSRLTQILFVIFFLLSFYRWLTVMNGRFGLSSLQKWWLRIEERVISDCNLALLLMILLQGLNLDFLFFGSAALTFLLRVVLLLLALNERFLVTCSEKLFFKGWHVSRYLRWYVLLLGIIIDL